MAKRIYPVSHLSFSSLLLYLNQRPSWHRKYVLKIDEQQSNPSALVGTAFHKYLELTFKGLPGALETAQQMVRVARNVDFGKTGSVEKCLENLEKCVAGYHAHPLVAGEMVGAELCIEAKIPKIPLPFKAYIDFIHTKYGQIELVDWKTVHAFEEEPTSAHIIQSIIYYWLIKAHFKETPRSMTIFQVKVSKNSDGSPQTKPLTIIYADHPEYEKAVLALVRGAISEMGRKKQVYLLNPRDSYDAEIEWKRYVEGFKDVCSTENLTSSQEKPLTSA